VVPLAGIPDLMPELERLSETYGVLIPCYGHAGDGSLRATVVKRPEAAIEEWEADLPHILAQLYRVVADLGGTISGEHGIGSQRCAFLPLVMDPTTIALQRCIKQAFDPLNVLNPGRIFPPDRPSGFGDS
jgi:glycolate oxidase